LTSRRVSVAVSQLEHIEEMIKHYKEELHIHQLAMMSVDIPCGDGGKELRLEKDIKYLYSLIGREYLLPSEIIERLRKRVEERREN